jgi:hypothetical protein
VTAQKNGDCGVRMINETTWIFNSENWQGFHPDIIKHALRLNYSDVGTEEEGMFIRVRNRTHTGEGSL